MPHTILLTVTAASAVAGAMVDLRTRRVPNVLTAGTAVLGVSLAVLGLDGRAATGALLGGAVGLLLMLPMYVFAKTGAGDVKFLAALGTLLGPKLTVVAFIYTGLAGGALALLVAASRSRLRASLARTAQLVGAGAETADTASIEASQFAYAPAIALGALAAVLGF